jgi:predicted nuclease of predicted toxin-antitoxin system
MMRVLLDQGLAPGAADILRGHGWDAVHVSGIEMQTADDVDILNVARNTDRICITLDHAFHAHLAFTKAGLPFVVLLRVQGLDGSGQAALIRVICDVCRDALLEVQPFQLTQLRCDPAPSAQVRWDCR